MVSFRYCNCLMHISAITLQVPFLKLRMRSTGSTCPLFLFCFPLYLGVLILLRHPLAPLSWLYCDQIQTFSIGQQLLQCVCRIGVLQEAQRIKKICGQKINPLEESETHSCVKASVSLSVKKQVINLYFPKLL